MTKKHEEEYEDTVEETPEYEDEYPEEEPLEYQRHEGDREKVGDKPTIDNFFDTEALLASVEKTMKGFQKKGGEWVYDSSPKASSEFINMMINSLRSVINPQNMVSSINEQDSEFLLLEKNKEFIFKVYEEPSIEDEDVETIINIFDHSLELFMGQVKNGFGARTLRQISAAVSYEVAEQKKEDSMFSFGYGGNNLVKLGGRR